jgi:type I restriction enzyme M protein
LHIDKIKCILLLKNINNEYSLGDSLTSHKKSVNADVVLTQAPWGVRLSPELIERIKKSKYIQMNGKIEIPTSASDSLWIQHSLYHLNENGRAILLMPQGWLFRGGYDGQLRDFLLESDLIEAVIGLPSGLLKITNIPTVLLIFNKNKVNKEAIHFIDASQMGANIKRHKGLNIDEIRLIADLVKSKHQTHPYYRSVSLGEIKEKHNELTISHYFNYPINLKVNDLKNERHKLELAQRKFNEAQEKIMKLIVENL